MASQVDIFNLALDMLGTEDVVTGVNDTSVNAKRLARSWPLARDAVLRAHPWNCAIARVSLPEATPAPLYGFAYRYPLSTEPYCLRVLELKSARTSWKVEGRAILTDDGPPLSVKQISRVTDVENYDALLVTAAAARLAWTLAYAVTQSRSVQKDMKDTYFDVLSEAKSVDGQEGTGDEISADELLLSRA